MTEIDSLKLQLWAAECKYTIAMERAAERYDQLERLTANIMVKATAYPKKQKVQ